MLCSWNVSYLSLSVSMHRWYSFASFQQLFLPTMSRLTKYLASLAYLIMEKEKEVGIYEAKNRLSALVEEVAQGKRIWITRHGQRVAQLSSGVESDKQRGGDLIEGFRKLRESGESGKESLKELIEEGRR